MHNALFGASAYAQEARIEENFRQSLIQKVEVMRDKIEEENTYMKSMIIKVE